MPAAGIRVPSVPLAEAKGAPLIQTRSSPNCGPRRDGLTPDLIVLHYTAMDCAERAIEWLCTPESQVSAHYVISKTGSVTQLVAEDQRAWHAGAGGWQGSEDVNSRSIGIELDNDGLAPFSEPLMAALEGLLPQIMERWGISAAGVIGHSDCAPGRKVDPGLRFDWRRLAWQGLAVWPELGAPLEDWDAGLRDMGYPSSVDAQTRLAAFRLRIGSRETGPITNPERALIAGWPIDPTGGIA